MFTRKITNSIINPDVEVSPSMIAGFLTQAGELLRIMDNLLAKLNKIYKGFEQIGQDLIARELSLENNTVNNLATQENLAQEGYFLLNATAEQG